MTRTCAAQRGGDLEVAIKRSLGKLVSQALTEGVQLVSDGLRLKPYDVSLVCCQRESPAVGQP